MVVHTCNPSTGEVEAGGLRVESQIGLHNKTWCPKKKKKATQERERDRRISVQGQPGQKLERFYLRNKPKPGTSGSHL
jgi:hypothetical protein